MDIPIAQSKVDPLDISNEDIQRVLNFKCQIHPNRNAEFLHLIPNVENARICNLCIKEQEIQRKNYQEIKELLSRSSENDLLFYPLLTDSQLGEMIRNNSESMDDEINLMDSFFQELTAQIELKIEGRKEARKQQIMRYGEIYQRSKVCWSEILDIQNLRGFLLEENEERLAQFVHNHVSNAERNTQRIKEVCDEILQFKNEFSVEQPGRIRSLVCAVLEEIDFFQGTHPSPLHAIEQCDEYIDAFQKQQKELENYQSQSNQAQQNFLESIRVVKENDSQEISRLTQEIIALKQDNQKIKKLIESNASLKEQLNRNKKTNQYLSQQIEKKIKEVQKTIQEQNALIQELSSSIYDQKEKDKSCCPCFWSNDSNEKNLELVTELQRKSQETDQLFLQLSTINMQIQEANTNINKEIMSLKSTDLLPTTNLLLGNYKDSKKLLVRKNDQRELEFFNDDDSQEYFQGSSYLDFVLDLQVNYVVNVKLEQNSGQEKYFWFGLISDQKKDQHGGKFNDSEVFWYCEQIDQGHINTQIKGQPIKTNDNSLEQRSLEMRINIQRKILKVGSLPNYDSVVQIDQPERIQPDIPYRFYLGGLCKQTKITITKLATVSQFDNLM